MKPSTVSAPPQLAQTAPQNAMDLSALQARLKLAELVFDHIEKGAVVTDAKGYILYFNRPYARFLGVDPEAMLGRHVTEVLESSRMHVVAETGKAEVNELFTSKGRDMVVQRIPTENITSLPKYC